MPVIINSVIRKYRHLMRRADMHIRHPGMLNYLSLRIPQLCPHSTRAGQHRLSQHDPQPVRLYDLHIIIEQQDVLSLCRLFPQIAHRGKIESHRMVNVAALRFHSSQKILNCLPVFRAAPIIYHNKLYTPFHPLKAGAFQKRTNTLL